MLKRSYNYDTEQQMLPILKRDLLWINAVVGMTNILLFLCACSDSGGTMRSNLTCNSSTSDTQAKTNSPLSK